MFQPKRAYWSMGEQCFNTHKAKKFSVAKKKTPEAKNAKKKKCA